jgi:hypothetical protein
MLSLPRHATNEAIVEHVAIEQVSNTLQVGAAILRVKRLGGAITADI